MKQLTILAILLMTVSLNVFSGCGDVDSTERSSVIESEVGSQGEVPAVEPSVIEG